MINISVIIPTRNRAALLEKTLLSILTQEYPAELFEIIVVDNGSTDHTKAVSESFYGKHPNFSYIYDAEPGLHVGRHKGLKYSKGNILTYADDDIIALPTWLKAIASSFQDPMVGLVGGKNIPNFESEPPVWIDELWETNEYGKFITQYSVLDFGDKLMEFSPFFVWGCNFSIRKDILLQVGGFHPDGMPKHLLRYRGDGETAVSSAIEKSYKSIYNPEASVHHWVPSSRMTIDYLYQWSYGAAISMSFTHIREKYYNKNIRKISRISTLLQEAKYKASNLKLALLDKIGSSNEVRKAIISGYRDGYNFHRNEVKKDNELLKWVIKENYLD